jgi:hypothetical protein
MMLEIRLSPELSGFFSSLSMQKCRRGFGALFWSMGGMIMCALLGVNGNDTHIAVRLIYLHMQKSGTILLIHCPFFG